MLPILVWFRNDLRLADNPALHFAVQSGRPIIPVYIWSPDEEAPWAPGAAARWWTHHSLLDLKDQLAAKVCPLIIIKGKSLESLQSLVHETGAVAIVWNRRYEPKVIKRDAKIKQALQEKGIEVKTFNGSLIKEVGSVLTKNDTPYKVFTPFYRALMAQDEPNEPLPEPKKIKGYKNAPSSLAVEELKLLPLIKWDEGFYENWNPTRAGALEQIANFSKKGLKDYPGGRDIPGQAGTSRLSPYLHHGNLGPNETWWAIRNFAEGRPGFATAADAWIRQLVWRDFANHLLYHFPHTPEKPLNPSFEDFPWENNPAKLKAWYKGETGYPLVDAGMKELWKTGWMHNRVRMVTASFLIKHLQVDWRKGADWFWDTLVDANLANNTMGWQWVSGSGADASPYYRIFNPIAQGERFDSEGDYTRHWLPELKNLPKKQLYSPWNSPLDAPNYPPPLVDHASARKAALEAYGTTKE